MRLRVGGLLGILVFLSHSVAGQASGCQAAAPPRSENGGYIFEFNEKNKGLFCWKRPSDVHFVIVCGCGGGGGGTSGDRFYSQPAGEGGHAGTLRTVVLGPLTADVYIVQIGEGGRAGVYDVNKAPARGAATAGKPTTLQGDDEISVVFEGGAAGELTGNPPVMPRGEPRFRKGGEAGAGSADGKAGGLCGGGGGGGPEAFRGGDGGAGYMVIVPILSALDTTRLLNSLPPAPKQ